MLTIYKGDDTGGRLGKAVEIEITTAYDIADCTVVFSYQGVERRWTGIHSGDRREVFFSHNETAHMAVGVYNAVVLVVDASGKVRTLKNALPIKVTTSLAECYGAAGEIAQVSIGAAVSWAQIVGLPFEGASVELSTDDDVRAALGTIIEKLGGSVRGLAAALCAFLLAASASAYEPPRHTGTYTTNGVTYAQRGGLTAADYVVTNVDIPAGTLDYAELDNKPRVNGVELSGNKTAAELGLQGAIADYTTTGAVRSIVQGYGYTTKGEAVAAANAYTDASISETNEDFVAAVQAASPPVELPEKWALANITNASGGAVTAYDVGAAVESEVVKVTGDQDISGEKTFANPAYFNFGLAAPSTIAVYGQDSTARFEVDNIMTGDYVHFGVGDFGIGIGFDYTKNGSSYRVDLPERSGTLSVDEGWTSTYRALNEANSNAATRAQLRGAIEQATDSRPHLAIIDGELHVITITD